MKQVAQEVSVMQDVFGFRDTVITEYSQFSRSFTRIASSDIRNHVDLEYARGRFWPEPLIQINPNYERKGAIPDLVRDGLLHPACADIFQVDKPEGAAKPMHLFAHQLEAIAAEISVSIASRRASLGWSIVSLDDCLV